MIRTWRERCEGRSVGNQEIQQAMQDEINDLRNEVRRLTPKEVPQRKVKKSLDKLVQDEIRAAKKIQREQGCDWYEALNIAYRQLEELSK